MRDPSTVSTQDEAYADRLESLQGARWKQYLGAQLPYRWNLRRLLADHDRVLDVGCGIGRNLVNLGRGVGVDHNEASVHTARGRGLRAWTTKEWPGCADAVEGSYDALLLAHVLEHLDADTAHEVVSSYLAYLTPRARLVLICPQERGYDTDATHVRFVDFTELDRSARSWGFTPVRRQSFPFARSSGAWFPYNEFVLTADRG